MTVSRDKEERLDGRKEAVFIATLLILALAGLVTGANQLKQLFTGDPEVIVIQDRNVQVNRGSNVCVFGGDCEQNQRQE